MNRDFVLTDFLRDKGYAILIDRSAFIGNPGGVLKFMFRDIDSSSKVLAQIETNISRCGNEKESLEV